MPGPGAVELQSRDPTPVSERWMLLRWRRCDRTGCAPVGLDRVLVVRIRGSMPCEEGPGCGDPAGEGVRVKSRELGIGSESVYEIDFRRVREKKPNDLRETRPISMGAGNPSICTQDSCFQI